MKKVMKKSGFTLVEIMIVVAIIGLLAAIGIPSFQKARANSVTNAKANNVRIINSAVDSYAVEQGLADAATVTVAQYSEYLKGSMDIGGNTATLVDATVGTDFAAGDIY